MVVEAKPFVKWVGGKRQLIPVLEEKFPEKLGSTVTRYAEPFLGGGAVLFHLLKSYNLEEIWVNDLNVGLVTTYRAIQSDVGIFITLLKELQQEFISLEGEARKNYFLRRREEYNQLLPVTRDVNLRLAVLFMFLNRTAFNGIYRVNRKGQFNVPYGNYANPKIVDEDNLKKVNEALQNVVVNLGSYQDCANWVDERTFMYVDPPYRPLTTSSSFAAYTSSGFNDDSQRELARFLQVQSDRGVKIMMSNSDPKNVDFKDDFFDDLYSWGHLHRISARRSVNSDSTKRGAVSEILFTNYNTERE